MVNIPIVYCPALQTNVLLVRSNTRAFVEGKTTQHPSINSGCQGCFRVLLLITLIVIGIGAAIWAYGERLILFGVRTQATVTTERITKDSYDDPNGWYITYVFTVNAQQFKREASITSAAYAEIKEGAHIQIRYDPTNPANSTLAEITDNGLLANLDPGLSILIIQALIFLAICLVVAWFGGRWEWSRNRRLRSGRLVLGTIVSCAGSEDSDNDWTVVMQYTVTTPTGETLNFTDRSIHNDWRQAMPPPGTHLAVWLMSTPPPEIF